MSMPVQPPFTTMRPIRDGRRITVTVGPGEADYVGTDERAIQAALDCAGRLGGGTVVLRPGTFVLHNALRPHAGTCLRGAGEATVLRKAPGFTIPLVREADWFEYAVQVEDAAAFRPGSGLALTSGKAEWPRTKLFTVTAVDGNVLYLDRRTEKNFWPCENAVAQNVHSLIHGWETHDVAVEDLALDGNGSANPHMDGNYAAGVFLQYCNRWRFRRVACRNVNGDGFSFQVCDDIHFESCRSENNATLGFHPGSGAQRPVFKDCEASGNAQGLFWCWGVCDGLAEACTFSNNRMHGMNFGHRDTDNIVRRCRIENNGEVGVLFRREPNECRTPDRNRIERCIIRNNGRAGIDIQWATHDVVIARCRFEGSAGGRQATAVHIADEAGEITLLDNRFSGTAVPVCDCRPRQA